MARIRTIKPEFWDSPDTARASMTARLFFIAMWNWADDWGVGLAAPKPLIGFAFPNDDEITTADFPTLAKEVAECFDVVFYRVLGRAYYSIPSWDKHQRTERKAKRLNPSPDEAESLMFTRESEQPILASEIPTQVTDVQASEKEREQGKGNGGTLEQFSSSDADASDGGFSPDVVRLCNLLADLIHANGNRGEVGKQWLLACDRLIRIDEYTPQQIEWVMRWSQKNEFWQGNILSMPKLREKFDQLKTRAMNEAANRKTTNSERNMDVVAFFASQENPIGELTA